MNTEAIYNHCSKITSIDDKINYLSELLCVEKHFNREEAIALNDRLGLPPVRFVSVNPYGMGVFLDGEPSGDNLGLMIMVDHIATISDKSSCRLN